MGRLAGVGARAGLCSTLEVAGRILVLGFIPQISQPPFAFPQWRLFTVNIAWFPACILRIRYIQDTGKLATRTRDHADSCGPYLRCDSINHATERIHSIISAARATSVARRPAGRQRVACSCWAMRTCSCASCRALSDSMLGIAGSSAPPWAATAIGHSCGRLRGSGGGGGCGAGSGSG